MLDKQDLEQIQEIVAASEDRMMTEIRAAENRWMVFYESAIQPQFQLLAEGQKLILDTMTPKSKTEELEEEIAFMKSVLRSYGERISALEEQEKPA